MGTHLRESCCCSFAESVVRSVRSLTSFRRSGTGSRNLHQTPIEARWPWLPRDLATQQDGDGIRSRRGLETHSFPRTVPLNGYVLQRLILGGQLSPGSGEGQRSETIERQ